MLQANPVEVTPTAAAVEEIECHNKDCIQESSEVQFCAVCIFESHFVVVVILS
jgi:hypothetical protein